MSQVLANIDDNVPKCHLSFLILTPSLLNVIADIDDTFVICPWFLLILTSILLNVIGLANIDDNA